MNIGIDVRCLMEVNISGVGQYTLNLLTALNRIDKVNNYYLFYNSWVDIKDRLPKFDNPNFKYVGYSWPNKFFNLSLAIFNRPAIDKLLPTVEVFWAPASNFLAWSTDSYKMITCHDLSWLLSPRFYSLKGRLWHKLIKLEKLYQQADVILAVSANTKDDLINFNPALKDKIRVTHLGVNKLVINSVDRERVRNIYNLPDRFILYVGNIEPRKNLHTVIASFKKVKIKHPDLQLVIAGGSGWQAGYFREIVKLMKADAKIKYLGYVPEEDKFNLLSLATVFLYPSFYEGFGLPPIEAMSQGCPVVASNISSLPEVVGEAGLLVDPHNVNQVALAVEEILTDDALKDDLIKKGKQRALQFEWTKTAQQMISIFNNL